MVLDPRDPRDPARRLRARELTYDLLARLYLREPDVVLLSFLRALPGFEDVVPREDEDHQAWLDDQAVEYERVFGMNAYPYESLYTSRDLMLNTGSTERVAAFFRESGFDTSTYQVGAPDHLGVELSCMRELAARERAALENEDARGAAEAREAQARFLGERLAGWAPIYAQTLQRIAHTPLYALMAELTAEIVLTDHQALGGYAPGEGGAEETMRESPSPRARSFAASEQLDEESPLPLGPYEDTQTPGDDDGEGSNLSKIVRRLITPVDVGVFLSRSDIMNLAKTLDLPVIMGDRFQMLRGLFASAGQFEQVPALLDSMDVLMASAVKSVEQLSERYPAWVTFADRWIERMAQGRDLMREMRSQAVEIPSDRS